MKPRILLLAGEESGVLYAGQLAERLKSAGAEIRGYGDFGFRTADLAVMGFWTVVRKLFYFLRVARTLKRAIREWRPDVVVTVDYPGLNLKFAAYAKRRGALQSTLCALGSGLGTGVASRKLRRPFLSCCASSRLSRRFLRGRGLTRSSSAIRLWGR